MIPRRNYGWKPQLPDFRDYPYVKRFTGTLPAATNNRPKDPFKPWDQGQLGSCTGHGWAGVVGFLHAFEASRLFIYYNERKIEGTIKQDAGAEVRDGAKALSKVGVVHESEWTYSDDGKKFKRSPGVKLTKKAAGECLLTEYQALDHSSFTRAQVVENIKDCLASGLPFVFGFSVYESFESDAVAKNGIAPMPAKKEQLLGGHCVMAIDYEARGVWCRNSWGAGWGDAGYFLLPWGFFESAGLSSDMWVALADKEGG